MTEQKLEGANAIHAAAPEYSMTRYLKRFWTLAVCLASLAGFVDAIGFMKLGGLFVSFMSGNSTRLAVGAAQASVVALTAAGLIACFCAGVVAASLLAHAAGGRRKGAVLLLVCLFLAVAAAIDGLVGRWTALIMAAAMGAANCVFQRNGEVSIPVTYMTGTLVKLGQHFAAALLGHDRLGWLPFLLLWGGLVGGAVAGAILFPVFGTGCLWIASAAAALLAVAALLLGPAEPIRHGAISDGSCR